MQLMIPFTPHIAHECLSALNSESTQEWPKINEAVNLKQVKLAVQVNGKTRDVLIVNTDLKESDITKIISDNSKAKKFIQGKKIARTIFVKNKIINYIIAEK